MPTFCQIKARVASIRQKAPKARIFGIHSSGRWTGDTRQSDGEQIYVIQQCDSPLAMRVALRQPVDEGTLKVLVTGLEDKDLSEEILLRLAKRALFGIKPWEIVRSMFQAHAVDPRLAQHGWLAEMLLELIPAECCPAAHGGFLDAETVWPLLLSQAFGMPAEAADLMSLLKWSLDGDATARYSHFDDAFRNAASQWLVEKAGPVAKIVLQGIQHWDRPDAVPLGLAAGVVFHPAAVGKLEKSLGKLEERFLGGTSLDADLMLRWSAAATEVVRALRHTETKAYRQTLQRADEILSEIQAESFAYLSGTSPLGFDQRLARFGQRLSEVLTGETWDALDELRAARQVVCEHDQSSRESRRLERVDMAVRLVRWLGEGNRTAHAEPKSFAEAATEHLRDGGFVDWARWSLRAGDPVYELSEVYARLFETVTQIREEQAQHFAGLLADWTAAGAQGNDVLPVEWILAEVVAPLAANGSVLVVLVDGMSVAVCRELLADLTRHEWVAICEPGRSFNRPGVATVPSKTEYSRTSLLTGRLQVGSASEERTGFGAHPAMLSTCRSGLPPILFHKPSLQDSDDAVLAAEVRKEIASTNRRIVGVVVNAVDDHLLKGEQLDTRWVRDEIRVLPALLHEARVARRLLVLVSDHGHVLDCQVQARPCEGGERWRSAVGKPEPDEMEVQGRRVMVEGHRLIAPWSERVRYGVKKNGYHGGLSPQEMVVPIAVLSSTDEIPEGWQEQPVDIPAWWDEPGRVAEFPRIRGVAEGGVRAAAARILGNSATLTPAAAKPKPAKPRKGTLFDLEAEVDAVAPPTTGESAVWVERLLSSPVFAEQKRLGGRGLPADDVLVNLLNELDRRGGKLTSVALARALGFPTLRLPGLLAKAQRLLNVDGYAVLNRDDASDTVELNRELLWKQFDLGS